MFNGLGVSTLKYLINEHVRLLSLDFDSTMFVYFPVCSFFLLTFFPLCSFITSCSFIIMVKKDTCNSICFLWIEKIVCNFLIRLLAGALLAGALLAGALLAGALLDGALLAEALWVAYFK